MARFIACKVCRANIYRAIPGENDATLITAWNNRNNGADMPRYEHQGFPVTKIITSTDEHIVIDRMEWKDDVLILTVSSVPKVLTDSELWNFTTTASNYVQDLKNGIAALKNSSVSGLAENIDGLFHRALTKSEHIEDMRKRMLPNNYPKQNEHK